MFALESECILGPSFDLEIETDADWFSAQD